MKANILFFVLSLAIAFTCFAQDLDTSKLDAYFDALETHNKFMGSVAVSKDDRIIYTKSIGFTNLEKKEKASSISEYRIGSISKMFTAALIFKSVEMGKIKLEQTIENYFPELPNANKINIQLLLSHRSGIHNFTSNEDYLSWNTSAKSEEEITKIIVEGGSDFEPGSKAEYSNSNYVLLSYILEKTFNKSYGQILEEQIIKPLNLKNTYFRNSDVPRGNEIYSYKWAGEWIKEPVTDLSIPMGAGGIISTPTDLVKFSDALFAGKIVKEESLKKMETLKDDYGMGLFQYPFGTKWGFGHTGGIDGFKSFLVHFEDGNISYALTSNGSQINPNDISITVLSAIFNEPFEIPTFNSIVLTSEDLDPYLGIYSSADIPLKITVTKNKNTLMAQATGQPSFPLEATEKDRFKYDQAGIVMEFNPSEEIMVLKQGGGIFNFTKDK